MRWGGLLLALTLALAVAADTLTGRVVAVADGDTLTVLVEGNRQVKIRLVGIDAPEYDQPFGQKSRQSLSELTFGRTATVAVQKTDDYGRVVGTVTVGGVNVEAEQVRRGLAWVYRHYSDDARLLALEAEAKAARRGLWADANPMPPWEWRHGGKVAMRSEPAPAQSEWAVRCGAKRTCREMTSCEEARFYFTQCGLSRLDGDKDGTPCEALCAIKGP
ncbi:MAG: thermonuclease family protein [Candidatus Contendobacter sp.]|nr:thermonuclease family protein [Candidatus Contendobacter sp.]MDS4058987.1 thermonuclease family protein [Candidatus Contendobacter sp.]